MSVELAARVMLLLAVANGAPILARRVLGPRLEAPVDLGRRAGDGRRLLGEHKTWRGLAAGTVAAALTAPALGWPAALGAGFAAASLVGDLLSSLLKRRLGLGPGRSAPGLDQCLESGLPLLLLREPLALDGSDVVVLVGAFTVLDLTVSPLLRRLGVRRRAR